MTAEAVYGFVGVLIGSASTSVLTVYRERLASSRERDARQHQREQDRQDRRDAFQRESLLALQDAVSDLLKAVFNEQDRMLEEMQKTSKWPARRWETPTATDWEDAELRLQAFRARIFDAALRNLAHDIHATAMKTVWADSLDEAKPLNSLLMQQLGRFNDLAADVLAGLY